VFGAGGGTSSYTEVEETDLLILWGSNARETHPIFFHHVLKAVHRGAKLYGVDPRRSGSAQWADTWLGLDVGTDIALANTIAREIIHAGLTNDTFINHATTGYEEFKASVEPWTLEEGERVTGVPAETIRELAHAYARADRAILCWTLGITEHVTAVDNVLSLINLALLTGHVGRYGSGLNPLRGQNNVQGGGDMGAIPNKLPGFQDIEKDAEARARFEQAWGTPIVPKYGWHLSQMFDGMERGELGTLYVFGENPAQSEADSKRALELLDGLDFMIVQDILMTKTAEMADVVLPATASWCEVDGGTVTNSERRVQRMRKALDPRRRPATTTGSSPSSPAGSGTTGATPRSSRPGTSSARSARCTPACATTGSRSWAASSGRARPRITPARCTCTVASGRRGQRRDPRLPSRSAPGSHPSTS
jgi:predicted molibdopterin-dependent oxidoreductase YjgC